MTLRPRKEGRPELEALRFGWWLLVRRVGGEEKDLFGRSLGYLSSLRLQSLSPCTSARKGRPATLPSLPFIRAHLIAKDWRSEVYRTSLAR